MKLDPQQILSSICRKDADTVERTKFKGKMRIWCRKQTQHKKKYTGQDVTNKQLN